MLVQEGNIVTSVKGVGSGTLNHVPESNKQTKSAGRSDPSPTVRGGQSSLNRSEVNFSIPGNVKVSHGRFRLENDHVGLGRQLRPGITRQDPASPPEPHVSPM